MMGVAMAIMIVMVRVRLLLLLALREAQGAQGRQKARRKAALNTGLRDAKELEALCMRDHVLSRRLALLVDAGRIAEAADAETLIVDEGGGVVAGTDVDTGAEEGGGGGSAAQYRIGSENAMRCSEEAVQALVASLRSRGCGTTGEVDRERVQAYLDTMKQSLVDRTVEEGMSLRPEPEPSAVVPMEKAEAAAQCGGGGGAVCDVEE